jgi:hypothetical protein
MGEHALEHARVGWRRHQLIGIGAITVGVNGAGGILNRLPLYLFSGS